MSIRFILTVLEFILAVVFYIVYLIKKEGEYAFCSLGNIFLIAVSLAAVLVRGTSWMWEY